jgi:hypothetical protein
VPAFFAVLAGAPLRFKATKPKTLHYFLNTSWEDEEVSARKRTAYCNAMVVQSPRGGIKLKGWFLLGSAVRQGVAIMALAFCTIAVI